MLTSAGQYVLQNEPYLFNDHKATLPSAPPLAMLSTVPDCDNVAWGCHATPPTLSLCAVGESQMGNPLENVLTRRLT